MPESNMQSARETDIFPVRVFKFVFGFHFVTILGVLIGYIIYNIHSETNPLNVILTTPDIYIIGFLIVFALNFIYWIFSDKATFYNIKNRIFGLFVDFVFFILSGLGTVGTLFLADTFIL